MVAFLLFVGFAVMSIFILSSVLRSLSTEEHEIHREMATVIGVSVLLGSFLFLPWLGFDPGTLQTSTDWLRGAEEWASQLGEALGISSVNVLPQVANSPKLQALLDLAGATPTLTAIGLIFKAPIINAFLLIALILVLVAGLVAAGRCIVQNMQEDFVDDPKGGALQAVVALLAIVLLTLVAPKIDTLGSGEFRVRVLSVLAGARVGYGVWVAWLGLALLAFGGIRRAEVAIEDHVQRGPKTF